MTFRMILASILAVPLCGVLVAIQSAEAESDGEGPQEDTELWGGLYLGMAPEEAKRVIESKKGVKRAKYELRENGLAVMDVNTNQDFTLGGKKTRVELFFKDEKLRNIEFRFLDEGDWGRCIDRGVNAYNFYSDALSTKYSLIDGIAKIDSAMLSRLALQSSAGAFKPYGDDNVDDVRSVYHDGEDLLIQSTLVTTGMKYSKNAIGKSLSCSDHDYLSGYLSLIYGSKKDTEARGDQRRDQLKEAARGVAEDL